MSNESDNWVRAALESIAVQDPAVLVSIVGVQGSSPREPGARMLVTRSRTVASVGGGVLEHMAIQRARADLREQLQGRRLLSFPLDRESRQCCGGIVVLLFEPLCAADAGWLAELTPEIVEQGVLLVTELSHPSSDKRMVINNQLAAGDPGLPAAILDWQSSRNLADACLIEDGGSHYLCEYLKYPCFNVLLFGAGHVGRALVQALAAHHCRVLWVDARKQEFPARLPDNVTVCTSGDVAGVISQAAAGSYVLVMTHRHPLDFEICELALLRGDFALVGLIGSASKRRQFSRAMGRTGITANQLAKLCCPIGVPGIHAKQPQVIAASVVAQLLQLVETGADQAARRSGISEKQAAASSISGSF